MKLKIKCKLIGHFSGRYKFNKVACFYHILLALSKVQITLVSLSGGYMLLLHLFTEFHRML